MPGGQSHFNEARVAVLGEPGKLHLAARWFHGWFAGCLHDLVMTVKVVRRIRHPEAAHARIRDDDAHRIGETQYSPPIQPHRQFSFKWDLDLESRPAIALRANGLA